MKLRVTHEIERVGAILTLWARFVKGEQGSLGSVGGAKGPTQEVTIGAVGPR